MSDHIAVAPQLQDVCLAGRTLAYGLRGKTASQRAVAAAELAGRRARLKDLTTAQLAAIFKVSPRTLAAARRLTPAERTLVRRGVRKVSGPDQQLDRVIAKAGVEPTWQALCRIL